MRLSSGTCDVCGKRLTSYLQDEKGNCYCSESCYEKMLPKCVICNKPMKQWIESDNGKKYCCEKCYEQSFPKCEVCNKPMKQWIESENRKKYCSEDCYEQTLPKCEICNKPMKEWTESEDGKKYCSEKCYEQSLPRCQICNKPIKEWIESENGKKYCSEHCFLQSCPKCCICGKHTDHWIQSESGEIYCSEECWNNSLPVCEVCGNKMEKWLVSEDGKKYCSEECYSKILPKCMHCGRPMKEWLVTQYGRIYCSEKCNKENDELMHQVNSFCQITGLSVNEVEGLLINNSWSFDEMVVNVDQYMESLNGKITASEAVIEALKNADVYGKLANNLSTYNTMRGGVKGFKGFVFEELHAAEASLNGIATEVIANNGIADFQILKPDGTVALGQAKIGYKTSQIDWSLYKGQDIIIDKGNTELINSARKAGMNVIESDISNMDAQNLAQKMQLESKVLKRPNAPITSNLHSYHKAGVNTAKKGAAFGAGLSLGSNLVDLATGDKSLEDASVDVLVDTTVATASSYVIGAGTTAVANTAVGGAVISGVTAAGSALASTTVGASTIAAASTVTGAISATGAAITGTAIGSAAVGAVGSAATVIGTTAAGAAIVAAAPLVAAGAAVGAVFSIGKKLFGR